MKILLTLIVLLFSSSVFAERILTNIDDGHNINEVDLLINVQETQLRKFNLGLRWDNYYDLVAVANVQLNSSWIPGLRIEDEFQFAGIQKNIFSIYYPSRKLNFPESWS